MSESFSEKLNKILKETNGDDVGHDTVEIPALKDEDLPDDVPEDDIPDLVGVPSEKFKTESQEVELSGFLEKLDNEFNQINIKSVKKHSKR